MEGGGVGWIFTGVSSLGSFNILLNPPGCGLIPSLVKAEEKSMSSMEEHK